MGTRLLASMRRKLGAQLVMGGVLAVGLSLVALDPRESDVARLTALALSTLATVAVARLALRRRPRAVALTTACTVIAGLAGTGLVTDGYRTSFSALYVLIFVYVGCRLPSGSATALSGPAAFGWFLTNAPVDPLVWSRLPAAVAVWIVVGEALSARTSRAGRDRADLRRQAEHDALTGLLNRHVLTSRLREVQPGDALVLLDLDHFKAVNDTFGHATGDAVLGDLGRVVLSVTRSRDIAVRYGGEEVLLVLPASGAAGADRTLSRLRAGWAASHPEITFSAGVCVSGGQDPTLVLIDADAALYAAKAAGRNRTVHHGGDTGSPPFEPIPRARVASSTAAACLSDG